MRAVAAIVAIVVFVRLPALLQSVEGTDEGLYALVALQWLHGHLPYTTVWEAKPPLFFAILAAAMTFFGKSMFAIRIVNDLAIAATATALYAIGTAFRRRGATIGFSAACFYAALTISDSGQSAVAESFYAPFIALVFAIVLQPSFAERSKPLRMLGLGASLGAAVLVKESAAIEATYAAVVAIAIAGLASAIPLATGAVAIAGFAIAPYAFANKVALFWDANVASIARRAPVAVPDVAAPARILLAQLLAFFPATLLALGIPAAYRSPDTDASERRTIAILCGWFVAAIATVVAIREYLGNHFIDAMAPASVLGAFVLTALARRFSGHRAIVPATIVLALLAHAGYQFVLATPIALDRVRSGDATYGDATAELAAYLAAHERPGDVVYVADDRTALYVLLDATPPTRYAYPDHLIDRYQETIAGVDGPAEIARILGTSPAFVVRDAAAIPHEVPRAKALLDAALHDRYHTVFAVGTHAVYARNDRA